LFFSVVSVFSVVKILLKLRGQSQIYGLAMLGP